MKVVLILLTLIIAGNNLSGQKTAKKIVISGKVVDVYNTPISGAIIMIDGKITEKNTNKYGFYKVRVKPSASKIGVFIYSTGINEEMIDGRTTINFNLDKFVQQPIIKNNNSAGEEEINIGYGSVKRRNLTDQVSKIDATDKDFGAYNNIYDMIKGQVAGVEVHGNSITIQGANSFMSSTEPLFVVDGIVVSSIDDISPQMVKSIEILKGSSATIYGSRGANGVILINLKGAGDNRK